MSCLSQNFSGLLDANQQVERLKTQQGGPFQLGSTFRLWVLQSLNLPIYREVMAMRIMLGLLQPDPLQSTMMEQFSPLFAFLIFIEFHSLSELKALLRGKLAEA
jgi:hypothetical protein